MATGNDYLVFMGWFFCLIGFKMAVDGLLRGAGDMRMFTIANLANLFFRVAASMSLAPVFGIQMVWVTVPVGWLINWAISFARYRTGSGGRLRQADGPCQRDCPLPARKAFRIPNRPEAICAAFRTDPPSACPDSHDRHTG